MYRIFALLAGVIFWLWSPFAIAAPIVTMAHGDVNVVSKDGSRPAPGGHFRLEAGQTLELGEDAFVCMMDGTMRKRVQGPASFAYGDDLDTPRATSGGDASPLSTLLERKTTAYTSGATRGQDGTKPILVRPVEGTRIVGLQEIRWACDSCGPQQVVVRDPETWASLWTGHAETSLAYEGPVLSPGEYLLEFGSLYFEFEVAQATEVTIVQKAVDEALVGTESLSQAERASIEAAVWSLGGFPTHALAVIEAAHEAAPEDRVLQALLEGYKGMYAP